MVRNQSQAMFDALADLLSQIVFYLCNTSVDACHRYVVDPGLDEWLSVDAETESFVVRLQLRLGMYAKMCIAAFPRNLHHEFDQLCADASATVGFANRDALEFRVVSQQTEPGDGHGFAPALTEDMDRRVFEFIDLDVPRDLLFVAENSAPDGERTTPVIGRGGDSERGSHEPKPTTALRCRCVNAGQPRAACTAPLMNPGLSSVSVGSSIVSG